MSFFGKLFGKKPGAERATTPSADPATDPNMIRVFDGYGQELFISKEHWRANILPGAIKEAWEKPDKLYHVIVQALDDGLRPDVVAAAKHLHKIDSNTSRTACLWGVVLIEEKRLDEAEEVFRSYLSQHGDDGYVLSNLAKVYARKKECSADFFSRKHGPTGDEFEKDRSAARRNVGKTQSRVTVVAR